MTLLNEFARLYQLAACGLSEEDWEFLIEKHMELSMRGQTKILL